MTQECRSLFIVHCSLFACGVHDDEVTRSACLDQYQGGLHHFVFGTIYIYIYIYIWKSELTFCCQIRCLYLH